MSYDKQFSQDKLIFNVTEDLLLAMEDLNIKKSDLARRMGKSKANVSAMLDGDRNMTLRTLATICYELGLNVDVKIGNGVSVRHQSVTHHQDQQWLTSGKAEHPQTTCGRLPNFKIFNNEDLTYVTNSAA
jgi:DNA-binding Xre family transcriptional regulator